MAFVDCFLTLAFSYIVVSGIGRLSLMPTGLLEGLERALGRRLGISGAGRRMEGMVVD